MPQTQRDGRVDVIDHDELIDALVQTSFVVMAILNKLAADHDLSLTQLRVFGVLRDRRLRMAKLADFLGLEKSTMTGLVDRAVQRGLLERGPNDRDGRAVDVFLSKAGEQLADEIYQVVEQALAPLTKQLTAADRRRLQVLLARVLGAGPV